MLCIRWIRVSSLTILLIFNLQNPMSSHEETNPHLWPRQQPGFPSQYDEPTTGSSRMQPWQQTDPIQTPAVRPRYQPATQSPEDVFPELELVPLPPVYQQPHRVPLRHQQPNPSQTPAPQRPSYQFPEYEPVPPPVHRLEPARMPVQQPRKQPMPAVTPPRPPSRRTQNASHNLMYPSPRGTRLLTWFAAVFCAILWIVIILGGLLVLIIYLVYRPRNPHFQIMSATLNSAYLDMGYLLNADLTLLGNFTNPSSKVRVDFNYVILQLYFKKQLIASQYIEPFSSQRGETRLASIEMVTSQVRLPVKASQELMIQIKNNTIAFELDGLIHARSNFGSIFRYSYWLYSQCSLVLTGPPSGIMLASKCKTKR